MKVNLYNSLPGGEISVATAKALKLEWPSVCLGDQQRSRRNTDAVRERKFWVIALQEDILIEIRHSKWNGHLKSRLAFVAKQYRWSKQESLPLPSPEHTSLRIIPLDNLHSQHSLLRWWLRLQSTTRHRLEIWSRDLDEKMIYFSHMMSAKVLDWMVEELSRAEGYERILFT